MEKESRILKIKKKDEKNTEQPQPDSRGGEQRKIKKKTR